MNSKILLFLSIFISLIFSNFATDLESVDIFLNENEVLTYQNLSYPEQVTIITQENDTTIFEEITIINELTIVSINENKTFLYKNGILVTNETKIENEIRNYYSSNYYPEIDDLILLKNLLINFNDTRSDQDLDNSRTGTEEACLRNFGLYRDFPAAISCLEEGDRTGCDISVSDAICPLYNYMGFPCGVDDRKPVTDSLIEFVISGNKITELIYNSTILIESFNEHNIYTYLYRLEENVDDIENYANKMYYSRLRTPSLDWTDQCTAREYILRDEHCLSQCFRVPLNFTYLEDIKQMINDLKPKTLMLFEAQNTIDNIITNQNQRFFEFTKREETNIYLGLYEEIKDKAFSVLNEAKQLDDYFYDINYANKIRNLEKNLSFVNNSFTTLNFTNVNESIIEIANLIILLEEKNDEVNQTLEEIYNLANQVNSQAYLLDLVKEDELSKHLYDETLNIISYSRPNVPRPITYYNSLIENITNNQQTIDRQFENLKKEESLISKLAQSISRKLNIALFNISLFSNFNLQEQFKLSSQITLNIILFFIFSLFSFIFFIFILTILIFSNKLFLNKKLSFFFISFLFLLFFIPSIFSLSIYYLSYDSFYYEEKPNSEIFSSIFLQIYESDSIALIVESSPIDENSINSCYEKIKEIYEENQKNIHIIYYEQNNCIYEGRNEFSEDISGCANIIDSNIPIVILSKEEYNKINLYSFPKNIMHIMGDDDLFNACLIKSIVK